jgi:hypothetical protein
MSTLLQVTGFVPTSSFKPTLLRRSPSRIPCLRLSLDYRTLLPLPLLKEA